MCKNNHETINKIWKINPNFATTFTNEKNKHEKISTYLCHGTAHAANQLYSPV